jgi:hypothetical protein
MPKLTRFHFKKFLRENPNLYIKCDKDTFTKAENYTNSLGNTFGIKGVWIVGKGGDNFSHYEDEQFIGIKVYNCCVSFILAKIK